MQPINTGFSFSDDERDRVYDEKVVSADMLDFLMVFMDGKSYWLSRMRIHIANLMTVYNWRLICVMLLPVLI